MTDRKNSSRSNRNIYLATCSANIASMAVGCVLTWSSPTLPKITERGEKIYITEDEGAWLTSLLAIGAMFGPFVSSAILDLCGRKWTIIGSMFVLLLSWSFLGYFDHLSILYSARIIAGIGVGILFTALPMYVSEISPVDLKGSLGSFFQLFLCFGCLVSYTIGPYVSYQMLVFISATIPLVCILTFIWIPESPFYLLYTNRKQEAVDALMWLRGYPDRGRLQNEITDIMTAVTECNVQQGSVGMLFTHRAHLKALYYAWALVFFQQMAGINVVLFYAQTIFEETGSTLSPSLCTIIIGLVMTASAATTAPAAKICGVKRMLCISAAGISTSLGALGLFFFMKDHKMDTSSLSWLPVASLVCFIISYSLGFGPFVWVIMADIFPSYLKSIASAFTASFCWLLTFVLTKFFGVFTENFGEPVAYWMFAATSILALAFILFQLPDTDGKSYNEIQNMIQGNRNSTNSSNIPMKA